MKYNKRIEDALRSYLRKGSLTKHDLKNLDTNEKDLVLTLIAQGQESEALAFLQEHDTMGSWKLLYERIGVQKRQKRPSSVKYLKYAAIFIGILGSAYYVLDRMATHPETTVPALPQGITLMTQDKGSISLEGNDQTNTLIRDAVKQVGDTLVYSRGKNSKTLVYDELFVPNGRTFNLKLSDGSVVHMNSGSKIRFPITFSLEGTRQVYLSGEAFFKIAHDSERPFKVQVDDVNIEVLGTEFNVAYYPEDFSVKTVLVKGSVAVSTPEQAITILPGELASWDINTKSLESKKVNVEDYIGWIQGEMEFSSMTFERMRPKLERAYGVQIINGNPALETIRFNATFDKNIESIDDVLRVLTLVHKFTFRKDQKGNITIN